MWAYGLDVSKWQGTIRWADLDSMPSGPTYSGRSPVEYVIMKATQGTATVDSSFARNSSGCPVLWGAYHFGDVRTSAVASAAHHVRTVEGAGRPSDFGAVLDIEVGYGRSRGQVTDWCLEWLATAERLTGRVPLIYSYRSFFTDQMRYDERLARFPLWLAQWVDRPESNVVSAPGPWGEWAMWQTSDGRNPANKNVKLPAVDGVGSHVDRNIMLSSKLAELTATAPVPDVGKPCPDAADLADVINDVLQVEIDARDASKARSRRLRALRTRLETEG